MKDSVIEILLSFALVLLIIIFAYVVLYKPLFEPVMEEYKNDSSYSTKLEGWDNDNPYVVLLNNFRAFLLIMSLVFLFIAALARLKNIIIVPSNEYERDPKNIIDPSYAEVIIDGKTSAKDLIMTCITNLIYKKNLELVGDTSIKLIKASNMTDVEKWIMLLLFDESGNKIVLDSFIGNIIDLSDIKEKFIKSEQYALDFQDRFLEIKEFIKEFLVSRNYLSGKWARLLKHVKVNAIILMLSSIFFFLISPTIFEIVVNQILVVYFAYMVLYSTLLWFTPKSFIKREKRPGHIRLVFYTIIIIWIFLFVLLFSKNIAAIQLIGMVLLNLLTLVLSNTVVYTKTGKEELKKATKFKRFLVDYSLMEERDLQDIVIWDEYLVYATAFGIPSKVTSKLAESIMNLNVNIQIVSSVLNIFE